MSRLARFPHHLRANSRGLGKCFGQVGSGCAGRSPRIAWWKRGKVLGRPVQMVGGWGVPRSQFRCGDVSCEEK